MEIIDYQKKVDDWIKDIGVRYFSELTNMTILMEEVGELSRYMSRKYGEQSFKRPDEAKNVDHYIKEELADIIFVITCLANQMKIDISEILEKNLDKKTKRDKNRHKNNPKL